MNVLIIENEKPAADKLCRLLKRVDNTIEIKGVLETVESSIGWLQDNPAPDIIMMDIQLDDGLCFEIFETIKVETPVIFTTAFDEYMLKAFKVNSIDYLLKPVGESELTAALDKHRKLYSGKFITRKEIEKILSEISGQYKSRFLIKTGLRYRSVAVGEISHFYIRERNVFLQDMNGRDCAIDYSLDHLQKVLDPGKFFRINRECIINIDSISRISGYSTSRLKLTLRNGKEEDILIVSRDKVAEFKKWIDK